MSPVTPRALTSIRATLPSSRPLTRIRPKDPQPSAPRLRHRLFQSTQTPNLTPPTRSPLGPQSTWSARERRIEFRPPQLVSRLQANAFLSPDSPPAYLPPRTRHLTLPPQPNQPRIFNPDFSEPRKVDPSLRVPRIYAHKPTTIFPLNAQELLVETMKWLQTQSLTPLRSESWRTLSILMQASLQNKKTEARHEKEEHGFLEVHGTGLLSGVIQVELLHAIYVRNPKAFDLDALKETKARSLDGFYTKCLGPIIPSLKSQTVFLTVKLATQDPELLQVNLDAILKITHVIGLGRLEAVKGKDEDWDFTISPHRTNDLQSWSLSEPDFLALTRMILEKKRNIDLDSVLTILCSLETRSGAAFSRQSDTLMRHFLKRCLEHCDPVTIVGTKTNALKKALKDVLNHRIAKQFYHFSVFILENEDNYQSCLEETDEVSAFKAFCRVYKDFYEAVAFHANTRLYRGEFSISNLSVHLNLIAKLTGAMLKPNLNQTLFTAPTENPPDALKPYRHKNDEQTMLNHLDSPHRFFGTPVAPKQSRTPSSAHDSPARQTPKAR